VVRAIAIECFPQRVSLGWDATAVIDNGPKLSKAAFGFLG
jgi:hypothetical protein